MYYFYLHWEENSKIVNLPVKVFYITIEKEYGSSFNKKPFQSFPDLSGSTVRRIPILGIIFHFQERVGLYLKNLFYGLSGFIKCSKEKLIELQIHNSTLIDELPNEDLKDFVSGNAHITQSCWRVSFSG